MKLLVTGGAGFIGSNFILYWLKNHTNDQIVNLDKLTYAGNLENLASISKDSRYSFIQGDICDPVLVDKSMEGVDTVVHFAAESHVDRSIKEPSNFVRTNLIGTQVLLDCAIKKKIRHFHHISTDEVFGSLALDDKKFNEDTCYDPRSPYSASKAGADHLVRAYFHTFDLPITITNCSNNFGPYQFPEKFIPLAITNIIEEKKVPVYGNGLHIRDWLHVEDHCRAIELVLQKGTIGQTYCIGGLTDDVTNIDIIRKIFAFMDKDESMVDFVKDRPGHDLRYAVDWSKIHEDLGWSPQHSLDEWLENTVTWYKDNKSWWQKIKRGQYQSYYEAQYGEHT